MLALTCCQQGLEHSACRASPLLQDCDVMFAEPVLSPDIAGPLKGVARAEPAIQ